MEQIEKAIESYMKVNDLKEINIDSQSITSNIYGAMILLMAINSEYNFVNDAGKTLSDIILYKSSQELNDFIPLGLDYSKTSINYAYQYLNLEESDLNKIKYCLFLDEYLNEFIPLIKNIDNDIPKVYQKVKDKIPGLDDNKNMEIIRFYFFNSKLKDKVRSGWDETHWNVSGRRESIADHIVGSMTLALCLGSIDSIDVDISSVLETLCLHEIGEILIGDITPFDNTTKEEKRKVEHQAMAKVLGNLSKKDEYLDKLYSFDEEKDKDFKFCHYCDKLEADIQAKVYQDKGRMNSLDNQSNNVVFNKERTIKMVDEGATTSFDIWYLYDRDIYTDDTLFTETLNYIKTKKLR